MKINKQDFQVRVKDNSISIYNNSRLSCFKTSNNLKLYNYNLYSNNNEYLQWQR